jgi:hypothetical protein
MSKTSKKHHSSKHQPRFSVIILCACFYPPPAYNLLIRTSEDTQDFPSVGNGGLKFNNLGHYKQKVTSVVGNPTNVSFESLVKLDQFCFHSDMIKHDESFPFLFEAEKKTFVFQFINIRETIGYSNPNETVRKSNINIYLTQS